MNFYKPIRTNNRKISIVGNYHFIRLVNQNDR